MVRPLQLVCMSLATVAMLVSASSAGNQDPDQDATPSVTRVAAELGLTPKSIAVCGLADQTYQLLERLDREHQRREALQALRERAASLTDLVMRLERAIAAVGDENDVLRERYETAKTELQNVVEGSIQIMADLFERATLGLPQEPLNRLNNWRRSRRFSVPDPLRVLPLTGDQWGAVVKALRAEARADRRGEALDPVSAKLLGELRKKPEVIKAEARLSDKLIAVQDVFELFTE